MKCPFCDYGDTGVIESRQIENESVVRRRRICKKCNRRFTTRLLMALLRPAKRDLLV